MIYTNKTLVRDKQLSKNSKLKIQHVKHKNKAALQAMTN